MDQLGDGFEACPKISNASSIKHIMPENGGKDEDESQHETMEHNNYVTPTEEVSHALKSLKTKFARPMSKFYVKEHRYFNLT
ncbi:hypothetical protein MAJ_10544, partial [Metarhizium majus ARSEF 297]